MRFDLECACPTVADVDDAGVLSRSLHYALASGGQALQMNFRRLVRAVLAPHHTVNAKLRERGLTA